MVTTREHRPTNQPTITEISTRTAIKRFIPGIWYLYGIRRRRREATATATAAETNDDGCHRCITVNLKVQTETETRQNQASKQATAPSSRGNKVYDEQQRLGQTKQ